MNRLWIVAVVLLCVGCGAEPSRKAAPSGERDFPSQEAARSWDTDFQEFLEFIRESAEENRVANTGDVDSDALNKIFVDKTVTWKGTLKYVHKGRPYFVESFVRVKGKMSRAPSLRSSGRLGA